MSGIAEVMHQLGYSGAGLGHLRRLCRRRAAQARIPVTIGQKADNLGDAAVVVISSAVSRGNPEVEAAVERRLPLVRRAEMLAELMRMQKTIAVAGTHGKTTTTSMVAALLDAGGLDPTVINGGIINRYGSNARLGEERLDGGRGRRERRQLPPARRDRSRSSPTSIPSISSITATSTRSRRPSASSSRTCPSTALAVMCVDHPEVQGVHQPDPRPADRHLRLLGARRPARRQCRPAGRRQPLRRDRARARRRAADRSRASPCRCRAGTMSRTRWPRSRSRWSSGFPTTHDPRRLRPLRRRQAPLHQGRRGRRRSMSSTIMPTTRSRSGRCCRRRAKAPTRSG